MEPLTIGEIIELLQKQDPKGFMCIGYEGIQRPVIHVIIGSNGAILMGAEA